MNLKISMPLNYNGQEEDKFLIRNNNRELFTKTELMKENINDLI